MSIPTARHRIIVAGLALVPLLAGLACAEPRETEAIETRLKAYETRFNDGDAEAVADLFSEDAVYYDPTGQVHEGRESVRRYYQASLGAGFRDMAIDVIEIGVVGDTAFDIARYTISGPNGETLVGYHLAILAKDAGQWRVQRTLVNAVMPEPPGQ